MARSAGDWRRWWDEVSPEGSVRWWTAQRRVVVGVAVGVLVPLAVVAYSVRSDASSNTPLQAERELVGAVCTVSPTDLQLLGRSRSDEGVDRLVFRDGDGRRHTLDLTRPWTIACGD